MLAGLGWFLAGLWIVAAGIPTIWFVGRTLRQQTDRLREPDVWPVVSVVVPARDEQRTIETGLRSLLASDYPQFEVIAIDDRSTDRTGEIMDRIASDCGVSQTPERRFRVIHVTSLPEGWLGKNNALELGRNSAAGEWILFTDGDVIYQPDTLRRAIQFAVAHQLDHLPLLPDIESAGVFETAFVVCFALVFNAGTQPALVSTRLPWFYVGVGAFNLVRREALDRAGGFAPIRLDILDDVKLGKMLKRNGGRSAVLRGGSAIRIRWQQSAWECITGLEKNAFASANFSTATLLGMVFVSTVVFAGPLVGTLLAGESRAGYAVALVVSHVLYAANAWIFGHSPLVFPLMIPSGLAFGFAFLRSMIITLRQGGVKWRETFYPLELLRQNIYR